MKVGDSLQRIWILEDESSDIRLLQEAMNEVGLDAEITNAATFQAGLRDVREFEQQVFEERPQIMVLDINVPGGSGTELVSVIRQGALKHMPCIMLTTSDADGDVVAAEGAGADAYFVKPKDFPGTIELVKEIQSFWLDW